MKHTAEEVLKIIKELENGERWKLLDMMYDEYYNTRPSSKDNFENRIHKEEEDLA